MVFRCDLKPIGTVKNYFFKFHNEMGTIMKLILIVDDMPANLEFAVGMLKDHYKVAAAKSGEKALAFLEKNHPDLILLDVNMPGMDGFETIRHIKENPQTAGIPVIFLTGDRDVQLELKGLNSGAVDFIAKPFEPQIMLSRINTQIELSCYRENLESIVANKTKVIEKLLDVMSTSLAELVESRDGTTGGHLKHTTEYFKILVNHMRNYPKYKAILTDEYVKNLYRAAPLHDIGKIGIDDVVLRKESGLDKNEFEHMKTHSMIGAKTFEHILDELKSADLHLGKELDFIEIAREMALYHHEKWCGTGGYPAGISGEDIPLPARILALADVYDALTSKRSYKPAMSHEESMKIIRDGRGTLFDPEITDIFIDCENEIKACLAKKNLELELQA